MSGVFWANGTKDRKPYVTREYGHRDPGYSRGWHTGVDTVGYNLNHAPQAGVVTFLGYDGSYGNTVVVTADDGTTHRTAHGRPGGFLVYRGQRVAASQPLMVQGTTGMSTGVHNHQEVKLPNGDWIDPIIWTSQKLASSSGGGSSNPGVAGKGEDDMAREYYRNEKTKEIVVIANGQMISLNFENAKKLLTIDALNYRRNPQVYAKTPDINDGSTFFNQDDYGWDLLKKLYTYRAK